MNKQVFISYNRGVPGTQVSRAFHNRLRSVAAALELESFLDQDLRVNPGGAAWRSKIDEALARTSHFVAILTTDYWLSENCRRELDQAVGRYLRDGAPLLLFVMAETISPELFRFNDSQSSGDFTDDNATLRATGDLNFLGPFDEYGRLVRLAYQDDSALSDQLAQLIDRLRAVL